MSDWGSGVIGDWESNTHTKPYPAYLERVHDTGGVLAIGDSILDAIAPQLWKMVNDVGKKNFTYDAQGARPTIAAVDVLEEIIAQDKAPGTLLMITGANDVFGKSDDPLFGPLRFAGQVARVRELFPGPIVWQTVYVDRWSRPADVRQEDLGNTGLINEALYTYDAYDPNFKIVPWYRAMREKPNVVSFIPPNFSHSIKTIARPATYLRDGVHPTPYNPTASNGVSHMVAWIQNAMFPTIPAALASPVGTPPPAC